VRSGARQTFFLTNGATQGNHALCLALAPLGTRIVAQRNSHSSIVDGLVLSGGIPSFVAPEYDEELGIAHCVTAAALEEALHRTPEAQAVFVVSPTYYGNDRRHRRPCRRRAREEHSPDGGWNPKWGPHDSSTRG
jgi:arginine decarboxylase